MHKSNALLHAQQSQRSAMRGPLQGGSHVKPNTIVSNDQLEPALELP